MPKRNSQKSETGSNEDRQTLLAAWIDQSSEGTKSCLNLSAMSLGVVLTGIFTLPEIAKSAAGYCLLATSAAFLICIFSCLYAFKKSAVLIDFLLNRSTAKGAEVEQAEIDCKLYRAGLFQTNSLKLGFLLALVSAAIHLMSQAPTPSASPAQVSQVRTPDNNTSEHNLGGLGKVVSPSPSPQPHPEKK